MLRSNNRWLFIVLLYTISGCANMDLQQQKPIATTAPKISLPSIQLPAEAYINPASSTIFGEGEGWVGRLDIIMPLKRDESINYFLENYPKIGWQLISVVKSRTSTLIFTNTVKTIQIDIQDSNNFSDNTKVTITASPKPVLPSNSSNG